MINENAICSFLEQYMNIGAKTGDDKIWESIEVKCLGVLQTQLKTKCIK